MPSVLAIISKAVFEKAAKVGGKVAGVGDVVLLDRYVSKNKGIAPVAEASPGGEPGALFLVTVRPPAEDLWLVAILEAPTFDGDNWIAPPNALPITDIGALKDQIRFATGAGISAKKGALGMSLQTPRVLAEADVALLRSAAGASLGTTPAPTKGHLNAHEKASPTPCLCRKCFSAAPESFQLGKLRLVRDCARAKGRLLWYWLPDSLEADRETIRRTVESRLEGKLVEKQKRVLDDLDAVLGGSGEGDADE
jgi:hypothetical protein